MKAVILAGGFGTRISEESYLKPKPMIEIGEQPILWHIMKGYSSYGVKEFIICAGYKQHVIKEWFADYFLHTSDITFDFEQDNKIIFDVGGTDVEVTVSGKQIENRKLEITPEEANNLKGEEVCLLCTGSQGEPLAALSRMANGTDKKIKLNPKDTVIFSSSPIPGNAWAVSQTLNKLALRGIKTYTNTSLNEIHSSGHANQEELKLMIRLMKPKYLMPIHGEYRMLKAHSNLGISCDIKKENIFIMQNGEVLSISNGKVKKDKSFPCYDIYVDGNRIGDIGTVVIKDRKIMSKDGILVVLCNINLKTKNLLGKVNITTRGFVLVNENEELLKQIENKASNVINNELKNKRFNYTDLKNQIINEVSPFILEKTGRKPIILPVIMDIKNNE